MNLINKIRHYKAIKLHYLYFNIKYSEGTGLLNKIGDIIMHTLQSFLS